MKFSPLKSSLFVFIIALLVWAPGVQAQEDVDLPTYVVQPGDTLSTIASKFGVTQNDIISVNNIANPDVLNAGDSLYIPGLEGISGVLSVHVADLGEDIHYLTQQFRLSPLLFSKLNHVISANEIYAGSSFIVPVAGKNMDDTRSLPVSDQNLLSFAAQEKTNPWLIKLLQKRFDSRSFVLKNSTIVVDGSTMAQQADAAELVLRISISPLPITQGATVELTITAAQPLLIQGALGNSQLNFFQTSENEYVSLQGISAIAETGLIPLEINCSSNTGGEFHLSQSLLLQPMYFYSEVLDVDPVTIDPAVVKPEEEMIHALISRVSAEKYWEGKWQFPTYEPDCIYSRFGNRRTYNGSDYTSFHAGIDYSTCLVDSLDIFAVAAGKVVYTDLLTVRGYATFIDHGWGVYSAYFHQAEIYVKAGDSVSAGQLIGKIGDTGRVTGPHLHFEVWVNGFQVNPADWLENTYP